MLSYVRRLPHAFFTSYTFHHFLEVVVIGKVCIIYEPKMFICHIFHILLYMSYIFVMYLLLFINVTHFLITLMPNYLCIDIHFIISMPRILSTMKFLCIYYVSPGFSSKLELLFSLEVVAVTHMFMRVSLGNKGILLPQRRYRFIPRQL